ncbi:MAG: CocE/NonD family hydrolase [Promethearchaeota archaeon]|nr:MAG: CocE/NonD family hydrolase [Candidatus Lokiarchaeota archaeon]
MRKETKLLSLALFLFIGSFAFITIPIVRANPSGPELHEYMVEMRDGVNLYTRVYLPDPAVWGPGPYPAILTRTPYGIGDPGVPPDPEDWPHQNFFGYAYVAQDTRGRYNSEGVDRLFYDDGPDGYDTIEWIASEPWCNGKVGMYGGSASGNTAYLAAGENPPHLETVLSYVASANLYNDLTFDGGAYRFDSVIWTYFQTLAGLSQSHLFTVVPMAEWGNIPFYMYNLYQNITDLTSHIFPFYPDRAVDSKAWMNLPIVGGNPFFGKLQPFGDEIMSHPNEDDFRNKLDVHDTIDIPILHVAGWFDFFSRCTIDAFVDLQYLGNQKLFVLPGTHGGLGTLPYEPYYDWFDYWLKGIDTGIMDEPPVWYIGLGDDEWRYADQWPPGGVDYTAYYMHSNGDLDTTIPIEFDGSLSFTYDPMNPVLTWGGRNLGLPAGSFDQTPVVFGRSDILSYTTEPLEEDIEIAGPIKVYLSGSSDCLDTDFTAKLIDVWPTGELMLVADGIIRARYRNSMADPELMSGNPENVYEFTISMGDICQVFKEGHSIRIDISSSNFPKHDRNLNSGGDLYTETEDAIQIAENTIHHAAATPSYIVLPIMPPKPKVFEGCAKIKIPDMKYKGTAELHIYEKAIYLHFEDQWIKWNIYCHHDLYKVDIYKCIGNFGRLNVVVINARGDYLVVGGSRKISFISMFTR